MPASAARAVPSDIASVREVLTEGALRSVYQPIVDLDTGTAVAYEALVRGPVGSPLERPDALFAAARNEGLDLELEIACRSSAIAGALDAGLSPRPLFVNIEPGLLGLVPATDEPLLTARARGLDLVVEVTERDLTARPAALLAALTLVRAYGWRVALDDVGADSRSLAFLSLVRPDVVKLDLSLVHQRPSKAVAEVMTAVASYRERTGAHVVAEGIETDAHLETARGLGATLGQGYLFGRPAPLPPDLPHPTTSFELAQPDALVTELSPFDHVHHRKPAGRADTRLLLAISRHLEAQAETLGDTAIIVSAFQTKARFTRLTSARYAELAENAAFVAALGVGLEPEPAPGVRGTMIDPDDPLRGEWSVVVIAPHYSAALVAKDLGDTGPRLQRRFDYILTHDRALVLGAAAALIQRVRALDPA